MKGNRALCSQFKTNDPDKVCRLEKNGEDCNPHYKSCTHTNIKNVRSACINNIPENDGMRCVWDSDKNECKEDYKICDDLENVTEEECHNLKAKDPSKQKCVYNNGKCKQEYIDCKDISLGTCNSGKYPLIQEGTYYVYNYKYKCELTTADQPKCESKSIYCGDYRGNDESICIQHQAEDKNKRCVYDSTKGCYEEYKTCGSFTDNKIDTDKSGCTGIKLLEKNEKCVYIEEEDTCKTQSSLTYSNCEDYPGNNKRVCERIILSPTNRSYCILDKDMKCKERPLFCEEAIGDEQCLHIAKANDTNRRCAYDYGDGKCYEEYIRCEDWIPNSNSGSSPSSGSTYCSDIKLFNGKKCKSETINGITRCYSDFKICTNAKTEEECKLIAKTGVTDPERKVCAWFKNGSPKCQETFKYCSDYRKFPDTVNNTYKDFCEKKIKPYDESGENIDIRFKCVYDNDIGCQRDNVECEDTTNPILCDLFSNYIKDSEKRHCVYYNGQCHTHSKKCEDVEDMSRCQINIIENFIINACGSENGKCVRKNHCDLMDSSVSSEQTQHYKTLCQKINVNCTYTPSSSNNEIGECKLEEKTCQGIKFYSNETDNKEICEKIQVTNPRKKCILKEDLSGCDEVYRELDFSTSSNSYSTPPDASNQGNSSGFIEKGIHLIMALLCLLI